MARRQWIPALLMALLTPGISLAQPVGEFDGHGDVGPVLHPGTADWDEESQRYAISGSGANMWGGEDEFHFVWKRLSGDFIVRAHARFEGEGTDPHRKLGWMVRESLEGDAAYVDAAVHGDGLTSLQFRRRQGSPTEEVQSTVTHPDVIQLERSGNVYTMSVAQYGQPLQAVSITHALSDKVFVGLFVCAHNADVVERAVFSNVRIIVPAPAEFRPYQDYLGSKLEILEVDSGHRRVVHTSEGAMQAPNWTPDGRSLIYNKDGLLYRFDLETGTSEVIDTGFATSNNNDHVLSFDGAQIGISHHAEDHDGESVIYTLPVSGGTPRKVTGKSPSYLHGWSPDGRWLTYTGGRDGNYDIYRIPAEGGTEERLTDAPELDDGSEYSPDGAWIYFNSARTGSMDVWRMRPDGSGQEQLTADSLNNWFPHLSPDGRTMAVLSYMPDVPAGDHPWYRPVYIRLMDAEDGADPRVVAYVYGGQGTINVPSWSPDGKYLAFVSNSGPVR